MKVLGLNPNAERDGNKSLHQCYKTKKIKKALQ